MGTCNDHDGLRIAATFTNLDRASHRADILAAKERIRLAQERAATWGRVRFVAAAMFCAFSIGNLIGTIV